MKNPSPKDIVLFSTFQFFILFSTLLAFAKLFIAQEMTWIQVFSFSISSSLIAFFLFYRNIQLFIYRKIKLIYKNIQNLKSKPDAMEQSAIDMSKPFFDEVNNDVMDWAKEKDEEIVKLQELEEYRKEFVGNVSHELKTPLFSIQGYVDTLIDGGLKDKLIARKFLKKASENVDRLIHIVNDLNTITSLESNPEEMEIARFDITELSKSIIEDMAVQAKEKNVFLEIKEGCDFPFYVTANSNKIQHVLMNLISNSIRYGKNNGTSKIGLYDMHTHILIEVSDDGIGIDKKHLPRLFERFYRVDSGRSRIHGGSGLGLSIVKHIIEAHNQKVHMRSTPDVGSTFGFTLEKEV